jgi:protein-S-isoprenylcysteine O-methyltransferase Ste14
MYEIPPGTKFLPLHLVVNIQKVGMPFYLAFLMYYFNNYSDAMMTYALLHGTYGVLWYAKHCIFPDQSLQDKCTFMCAIVCWVLILGPYMVPAYLLASGLADNLSQSKLRLYGSSALYIFGVSLALLSDAQKTYTLNLVKERPLLIKEGFFKYTRSPNYLGEMMIYLSFACVVNHWIAYAIVVWAWCTIFLARAFQKEVSLRKKKGFKLYQTHSWPLLPKINGRTKDSLIVYIVLILAIIFFNI